MQNRTKDFTFQTVYTSDLDNRWRTETARRWGVALPDQTAIMPRLGHMLIDPHSGILINDRAYIGIHLCGITNLEHC